MTDAPNTKVSHSRTDSPGYSDIQIPWNKRKKKKIFFNMKLVE